MSKPTHPTTMPNVSTANLSLESLFGVQGRIALVTGGGSGLGSYTAIALALHGAKVYIVGRREEKLKEVVQDFEARKKDDSAPPTAAQGRVIALPGDVSTKEGIEQVTQAYGGAGETYLDILVNGAGIMRSTGNKVDKDDGEAVIKDLWQEEWSNFTDSFSVNVVGVHFTTIGFAPFLAKAPKHTSTHPGPVVLNVASIAGLHIARGASISYATTKDAAIKLSALLAGRLMPMRVRVNCILPGPYPSEMTGFSSDEHENPSHPFHQMIKANPLQRAGLPEDFAGLILFLSSRAGAYLNNAHIVTDGGRVITQSAA